MGPICFSLTRDGKFTWIHPHIFDWVGFTQEEVIGHSLLEYVAPKDIKIVLDNIEMGPYPSGRTKEYNIAMLCKDGRELEGRVRIRYYPENIIGSWDRRRSDRRLTERR
jgi:hypothetical protein